VSGQRSPIESWSGLPSADQRKATGYALDDAAKAVAVLNRLLGTDVPAAYATAKKKWAAPVKPVAVPAGGAAAP
jgi:hypothetical protein